MKVEFIERLIEIGKTGFCELQDLVYFLPNYPSFNYSEPIFRRHTEEVSNLPIRDLIDYIKGLHLIELAYSEKQKSESGFGSPSMTFELLEKLDTDNRIKLYDWIAFNGGNFFIPQNITYQQNEKRKQDKFLKEQEKQAEAVANRSIRKAKRIDEHTKLKQQNNALRIAEFEKLNDLDGVQQLREIIQSEHHLDYYSKEYSEVTQEILFELNNDERKLFGEKLSKIKHDSCWQDAKLKCRIC